VFRSLAEAIDERCLFLKVCAPPERVAPLLPPRWQLGAPTFFMTIPGAAMESAVSAPAGYRLAFQREKWGLLAEATDDQGRLAAHGRLVIEQGWAVFDRIETDEAHRRRGLGSAVMRGLQAQALEAGARGGLLVATAEGERLYASLGWTSLSDYTSAVIPPPAAPAASPR
jgi:GNAT superfamily N-acetyltransferase